MSTSSTKNAPKPAGKNTAAKHLTNEQRLFNLLKDLHPIHAAMLRERIVCVVNETKKLIETDPQEAKKFDNLIIKSGEYVRLADKVNEHLALELE